MNDNLESEPGMPTPDEAPKTKKRKVKAETKPRKSKVKVVDPIGDLSDGEASFATGAPAESSAAETTQPTGTDLDSGQMVEEGGTKPAAESKTEADVEEHPEGDAQEDTATDSASEEAKSKPQPAMKLERLQKILAQAGVASRRSAEALITQGRVQVNGKVITQLGSKADAGRDHIRVDGKLLHGAERLRYFMLNKPKGFVTTVKDPEGRPTVMQFFERMAERLYPVGRLDYQSEGLLLVTNDGELANRLTKAASGVEKTYLVKVSGQPTENELDILRGGVSIERGKAGEGRVRTAPARVRQVRQGDNPWYEVVLIEGRNRELRKMFEEIGHFVEKIRRVGYGPLVLDQEPGKLRELEPSELAALRLAAEGKLRTPKAKELRRRNAMDAQLPTLAPRPSRPRPPQPFADRSTAPERTPGFRPGKPFGPGTGNEKPIRPTRPAGEGFRPSVGGSADRGPARPYDRSRSTSAGPGRFGPSRPADRVTSRPAWKQGERDARAPGHRPARPEWKREGNQGRTFGARPTGARPATNKPAWTKPVGVARPPYNRPAAPRREEPAQTEGVDAKRPSRLRIDAIEPDRPGTPRPGHDRPSPNRPTFDRAKSSRPQFDASRSGQPSDRPRYNRPGTDRPGMGRTGADRPRAGGSGPARPFRGEGGLGRPFTTSSGKPRAGGARPSTKPGTTGGHSYGTGAGARPARSGGSGSRTGGPRPASPRSGGQTGWKPKPGFSRPARPASGSGSKPQSGGFSKSSFKGKPAGAKRTGPRPSGKRPDAKKRK